MAALATDQKINHDRPTIFNTEYEVATNQSNISKYVAIFSHFLCMDLTEIYTKVRFISESTNSAATFIFPLQRVCSAEKPFSKPNVIYICRFSHYHLEYYIWILDVMLALSVIRFGMWPGTCLAMLSVLFESTSIVYISY